LISLDIIGGNASVTEQPNRAFWKDFILETERKNSIRIALRPQPGNTPIFEPGIHPMPPLAGAFRPVRLADHNDAVSHTSLDFRTQGKVQLESLRRRTTVSLAKSKLGILLFFLPLDEPYP
jgi:hypothetical protein